MLWTLTQHVMIASAVTSALVDGVGTSMTKRNIIPELWPVESGAQGVGSAWSAEVTGKDVVVAKLEEAHAKILRWGRVQVVHSVFEGMGQGFELSANGCIKEGQLLDVEVGRVGGV